MPISGRKFLIQEQLASCHGGTQNIGAHVLEGRAKGHSSILRVMSGRAR